MLLLFDLGNSRCKWAWSDGSLHPGAPMEYGVDFTRVLDATLGPLPKPSRALVVSVVEERYGTQLSEWLKKFFGIVLERATVKAAQCGVTNRYDNPAQLGADRWAALIGARARSRQPVCVVNCGTAVTIDALDANGVFHGGVILPGLATQRASLLMQTHGVRDVDGNSQQCLARNTADGVSGGTRYGLAGAIERIQAEQSRALGVTPQVLLAGGDAEWLQPLLSVKSELVPHLVLEGLQCMANAT